MKKITSNIVYLVLLTGMLINISCTKLIEIPDNAPNQIITNLAFADSLSAVNSVVGIYANNFANKGVLSGTITQYTALTSDELTTRSTNTFYQPYITNALLSITPTNPGGSSSEIWTGFYKASTIYQANTCIEELTRRDNFTATLKNQLIGECEVVRALSYFNLVNIFGGVPLITTSEVSVNARLPRASVAEVYAQIIKDLTDASTRLSDTYPSAARARPNRKTAQALLSRVYLYQQQWSNAEATATSVINSSLFNLVANVNSIFVQGSREAIWQIPAIGSYPYLTPEGATFVASSNTIIPTFYLSNSAATFFNSLPANDTRKTRWVGVSTVSNVQYLYPYKYKNTYDLQVNGNEGYVVFRLAEQYLIRAEARAQQNNLSGAIADLKVIRDRAGLTNTDYTAAEYSTKENLIKAITNERRIELFCEAGHRWFDLKRTQTINEALTAAKPTTWSTDGHATLFPIPNDQIKLNTSLTQNPGYQ